MAQVIGFATVRLSQGRFPGWPRAETAAWRLSARELHILLCKRIDGERLRAPDRWAALGFPQGQNLVQLLLGQGSASKLQPERLRACMGHQTPRVHPGAGRSLTGIHRFGDRHTHQRLKPFQPVKRHAQRIPGQG
jgi:hypothetical protein